MPDSFGNKRNGRVELIAWMTTHVNQDLVTRCEVAADSLEIRAVRRLVFFLAEEVGCVGPVLMESLLKGVKLFDVGLRGTLERRNVRNDSAQSLEFVLDPPKSEVKKSEIFCPSRSCGIRGFFKI